MLKLFKNISKIESKEKKNIQLIDIKRGNKVFLSRHFPISTKSWFNSIYCYDKDMEKSIPFIDLFVNNLIKMYFNIISKINLKRNFVRRRNKSKRRSVNKIFVSKTEMKHTNDKVIVTIYTYNRTKKYYYNILFKLYKDIFINMARKLKILGRMNRKKYIKYFFESKIRHKLNKNFTKLKKLYLIRHLNFLYLNNNKLNYILSKKFKSVSKRAPEVFKNFLFSSKIIIKMLNNKKLFYIIKLLKKRNIFIFKLNNLNNFRQYVNEYYNVFIKETLIKEMLYLRYNQLSKINDYKFNNIYLSRLNKIVSVMYNKKVEFNIINLKYVHLDSNIFSESILIKIRNKKNKLIKVLDKALYLPKINKLKENIWNTQQIYINKYNSLSFVNILNKANKKDLLHLILNNIFNVGNISRKLENRVLGETNSTFPIYKGEDKFIYRTVKFKKIRGVRLEIRGRLSKRLTASRSVSKLAYRGNLKNIDNLNKLSAVVLKGRLKSNIDYVNLNSKTRNGCFGLKSWISGG